MDLSRAKVVLILAFLALNLFLLYQLVEDEGMDNPALFGRKEDVSRMEAALQQANLTLDVPLPRSGMRAAYLVVEPWQITLEELAPMFWQGLEGDADVLGLTLDELVIEVDHDHNIRGCLFGPYELYIDKEGFFRLDGAFKNLNSDGIKQAADDFVKRVSFLTDFVYDYKETLNTGTVLHYRQEYGGFPLYPGYVKFYKHGEAGSELYLYRLNPVGFGERQREVIPPSTALWRFLEAYASDEQINPPTSIVDFSLGYYSEEYDAQLWEIPPVWRIRLLNQEIYYINAFTGYHEES